PRPPLQVVYEASVEVRSSVVYASFIVALVVLPLFFLSGVQGRIFSPLGAAYLLSILASLGVALTVTPALALSLLSRHQGGAAEGRLTQSLKTRYARLLPSLLARPWPVAAVTALLILVSVLVLPFLHSDVLPELREGKL